MKYKISGHEKFSLRYSWLPKAVMALKKNPKIFSHEDEAMVEMGVGKNMVRSIRFWSMAAGIAEKNIKNEFVITEFGNALFGKDGLDPYLEDIKTLWLIHWKLSTANDPPLLAWDYLLNRWHEPEITRSAVLRSFQDEVEKNDAKPSIVTLGDHLDVFFHTYIPSRGKKGTIKEDNLDSPLVELELMQKTGERETENDGKREPIYVFRREEKPEISSGLFIYCLSDFFFYRMHNNEATLSFREVSVGYESPGQVFKLPESDLRERLESLEAQTSGRLSYQESASIQKVCKNSDEKLSNILQAIY